MLFPVLTKKNTIYENSGILQHFTFLQHLISGSLNNICYPRELTLFFDIFLFFILFKNEVDEMKH